MTEERFSKIILAICADDSPVTPTGTFFEIVSYLEGYGKGSALAENSHSVFAPFLRWFSEKKLKQKSLDIPIRWFQFRELYFSDKEALENLSTLYKEYVESSVLKD
jgi:hypothetical protein